MKIIKTVDFEETFHELPQEIKRLVAVQEKRFAANWKDPRLHIKKLKAFGLAFSFRVTRRYRVAGDSSDSSRGNGLSLPFPKRKNNHLRHQKGREKIVDNDPALIYDLNTIKLTAMNDTPNKNVTLDDLAKMVKGGFDDVGKEFGEVKKRLDTLERGQEDIILKLDNVAYRFELVALQKRVEELEKRAGIKPSTATA